MKNVLIKFSLEETQEKLNAKNKFLTNFFRSLDEDKHELGRKKK